MPRDDGRRLHDDQRPRPLGSTHGRAKPTATVRKSERDSPRSRPLHDLQLMSQRQQLKLQARARAGKVLDGQEERAKHRHHRRQAYLQRPATARAATSTRFLVITRLEGAPDAIDRLRGGEGAPSCVQPAPLRTELFRLMPGRPGASVHRVRVARLWRAHCVTDSRVPQCLRRSRSSRYDRHP